jgi:hypothetical protein
MIFSVVERATFKRCERRWGLSSENMGNLEPARGAVALTLGSATHETLAAWTEYHHPTGDPSVQASNDPGQFFLGRAVVYTEDTKQSYRQRIGAAISEDELAPLYDAFDLGKQMIDNYVDYYKKPLPDGFRSIRTEQRTLVSIPGTEHYGCPTGHFDLPPGKDADWQASCTLCGMGITWVNHFLRGTIDNLLEDQRGKLWGLERKTYAIRPTAEKLQHDDQMLAYDWILRQLFGWDRVGGIVYDGLWKRPLSKRHPDLAELFFRATIIRPPDEVEEFGRLLVIEALQMAAAYARGLAQLTINRRWEGCYDCGMAQLCSAMSRGEDVDYVRSTFYRSRPTYIGGDDDSESE